MFGRKKRDSLEVNIPLGKGSWSVGLGDDERAGYFHVAYDGDTDIYEVEVYDGAETTRNTVPPKHLEHLAYMLGKLNEMGKQ